MKKGDLVLIDYVGKADGEVFDLSTEEKAEEYGINKEQIDLKQVPVLIGHDYVIEGLEEAITQMEVGDEKEINIPAEKAYGEREADEMETFPEKEFKKQGIEVSVGEQIMVGQKTGRVISKQSGRVRIDFNHPLSGKELNYWIRINEKITQDERKAEKIFEYRLGHGEIEFEDKEVRIIHKHEDDNHSHQLPEEVKNNIKEEITEYTGFEEVKFEE